MHGHVATRGDGIQHAHAGPIDSAFHMQFTARYMQIEIVDWMRTAKIHTRPPRTLYLFSLRWMTVKLCSGVVQPTLLLTGIEGLKEDTKPRVRQITHCLRYFK